MIDMYRVPTLLALLLWSSTAALRAARSGEKPIWSKQATALDLSCGKHPLPIASPDKKHLVEVLCQLQQGVDPTYTLLVKTGEHEVYREALEDGAYEILWAPNSRAFFMNGGTSAYAGFFVTVYQLAPDGKFQRFGVTRSAQLDMVATFPPCKAFNRDATDCARIARDPQFNMSGIAWTRDSAAVQVFAEVPCSSSYGGIMCQVLGYELSVPSGRILKRLSARSTASRWRNSFAWKVRIPEPAAYGPAQVTR